MASETCITEPSLLPTNALRQKDNGHLKADRHRLVANSTSNDIRADEEHSFDPSSSEHPEILSSEVRALESQQFPEPEKDPGNQMSRGRRAMLTALYLSLGMTLTLSSKSILSKLSLPWLLTATQATATSVCCFALTGTRHLTLTRLDMRSLFALVGFAILFALSIGISNVSLALVSLPLHQVLRSTYPLVIVPTYRLAYSRSYSSAVYACMMPMGLGAILTAASDRQASLLGTSLTVTGVLLACVTSMTADYLLKGILTLMPSELLLRLSPLVAMQCLGYAALVGEVSTLRRFCQLGGGFSWSFGWAVFGNAFAAFAFNAVSLRLDELMSARTTNTCRVAKHALTIISGIYLFSMPLGLVNGTGICIAVLGAAALSRVAVEESEALRRVV